MVWPPPRPEPPTERGESPLGVLPSLERLERMSPAQRARLVHLVVSWVGVEVEQFRQWVAELKDRP